MPHCGNFPLMEISIWLCANSKDPDEFACLCSLIYSFTKSLDIGEYVSLYFDIANRGLVLGEVFDDNSGIILCSSP